MPKSNLFRGDVLVAKQRLVKKGFNDSRGAAPQSPDILGRDACFLPHPIKAKTLITCCKIRYCSESMIVIFKEKFSVVCQTQIVDNVTSYRVKPSIC